jgi:hypothetical protein
MFHRCSAAPAGTAEAAIAASAKNMRFMGLFRAFVEFRVFVIVRIPSAMNRLQLP